MKPWRTPYRWLWRTAWTNISSIWGDLTWGVRNVIRWIPVIWFDADFDHSFLLEIMEYKFRRMAERHERAQVIADWSKVARQLRICALLCRRMSNESYSDNAAAGYGYGTRAWANEWRNVQNQDQEMLGRIIGKHLQEWWD